MQHDVQRANGAGGVYYYCRRCQLHSAYVQALDDGRCMDFSGVENDDLERMLAEWYLKYQNALEVYTALREEHNRRHPHTELVGIVTKNQGAG